MNTVETKFTPGPWNHIRNDKHHEVREEDRAKRDRHHWPVRICQSIPEYSSVDEANFNLIAAAPELYEQLDSLLKCVELTGQTLGNMDAARAAIAKARGEHA